MIGSPNSVGDGYLALLLIDKLIGKLIESDAVDKIEVAAWLDELKAELAGPPMYRASQAALDQLNASRIGS